MKTTTKNKKLRKELMDRGVPEDKLNDFIFKIYQVEYNEQKLNTMGKEKTYLTKKEKKIKRKAIDKKIYEQHKEEIKSTVQFRQKWREERREYWRRREDWAALYSKCKCVNERFAGCEQHHISKFVTVFIPKTLHRCMYHSLRSGKNMLRINDLVFEWLELQANKDNISNPISERTITEPCE